MEINLYNEIDTINRVKNRLKKQLNNIKEESCKGKKYSGKKIIIGNHLKAGSLLLQKILQDMGFDVEIVQDPQDIIDNIKTGEQYDVIITNNLYHFGKSGEKLLHTLKNIKGFNTPIIVHTIDKGKEFYYMHKIGFDGYLEKPVDEKSVSKVIENLLK